MSPLQPRAAAELRIASSRTRTARLPLPLPTPLSVSGVGLAGNLVDYYLGPPQQPASVPSFPGHSVRYGFDNVALQLYLRVKRDDAKVVLVLDFGRNVDLARIELYGNPLVPPIDDSSGPVGNFGLPRAVAVAVSEQPFELADLHGRIEPGTFYGDIVDGWRRRWVSNDLRAHWAWSSIHLGPCFGRYIALVFDRLAQLPPFDDGSRAWGIDLQRIVFYPLLEDVDHAPHVEHSVVSARVEQFAVPSAFWTRNGVAAPAAATHQSVLYDPAHDALLLPSALSGVSSLSPVAGEVQMYGSDPLSLDPGTPSRLFLVTEATTDEVPLLEGVHLVFKPPEQKGIYQGPKLPFQPDYLIRVHVTNDIEAAYSPDARHPSWRLVADERRVSPAGSNEAFMPFVEPVRARWVRITARPLPPAAAAQDQSVPFLLHRLDLVRCRSWELTPEYSEDLEVDSVSIRIRGQRLLDDYAFIDGEHGFGVTVEAREAGAAFSKLRTFRSLLTLIEETQHRIFANQRRIDKPVQEYKEESTSRTESDGSGKQHTEGISEARVRPEFGNMTATRSGTFTNFVNRPRSNLGSAPFASLPNQDAAGLDTTRTYEVDVDHIQPPQIDFESLDAESLVEEFVQWGGQLANQGLPVSVGIGGNVGGSLGGSFGVQITGSGGISATVGTQLGGGITHSSVVGSQGSVVRSESHTQSSLQKQETESNNATTSHQETQTRDSRSVTRRDLSAEVRRRGVEIRQGGVYEDLILVTIPINRRLTGGYTTRPALGVQAPPRSLDCLRVRIEHLPPGVRMDVEFRGRTVPKEGRA